MCVLLSNNFEKIWAPPPTNSIFFYSTPKEILNSYNLPMRKAIVPRVLSAVAFVVLQYYDFLFQ